ncbi:hypothetical protein HPP92_023681 [Vanilla planifolia]|uniref:ATP-dependent RNA helicase n=1 Tax=Vanilla planifolia TaxID=51239 RepID=A0A835PNC7_VANPL|nr:hypothetical protein HPP92_023681 [Vanilla planifolia]
MAGQLRPFRLLGGASVLRSCPPSAVLAAIANSRLKSSVFSLGTCFLVSHRKYSKGRSFAAGSGSFGASFNRRGELRIRSVSGQSKGSIEDKGELSDWISDLKTKSFHLESGSGEDSSVRGRSKSGGDGDKDSGLKKGRGRGYFFSAYRSMRTRGDSDVCSPFSILKGSRRGSVMKRRLDRDRDLDQDKGDFPSKTRKVLGNNYLVSLVTGEAVGHKRGASLATTKSVRREDEVGGRVGQRKRRSAMVLSEDVEEAEEDDDDDSSKVDDDINCSVAKDAPHIGGFVFPCDGTNVKTMPQASTSGSESYLSQSRFDQFSLSPLLMKGIKAAGYERMTLVQEATLPVILKGKDVLAKAQIGTGKTVAFLLPAIEVVAKRPSIDRDIRRAPIYVLVICPTRELAYQASAEASKLLKYCPSIGVQVIMGGTKLTQEQKRMLAIPCQILVATPGRLRDHIENTPGFASRLKGVKVLVLDEADLLLDMGFLKDIEKIITAVPNQRQTILFSATVRDEVRQICYTALRRDHEFINTVEEGSEETNPQVRQMHLIAPLEKQFSILYGILTDHIAEDAEYKVIVFCITAMVTRVVADLLSELHLNVREMHSQKPQSHRTRVSKEFKESKRLILVSSDVSARGVDYPNVTLVIQIGVPSDREQYIHRLGRTGRKGNEGKGILLLAPWEDFFLDNIRDLPITEAEAPLIDSETRKKVERALGHVEMRSKESAYQAWLAYYNSNKSIGVDKYRLVLLANEFSRSVGLDNPPAVPKLVLRKMGLNHVPGLRTK